MREVFQDVKVSWSGETKIILSTNLLRLIAQIEEELPIQDLLIAANSGKMPVAKVSICYGLILRYAGFDVSDDEVYERLLKPNDTAAFDIVLALSMMVLPKSMLKPEKSEPTGTTRPQRKSSRKKPVGSRRKQRAA